MINPVQVVDHIAQQSSSLQALNVYWLRLSGDRDQFAKELKYIRANVVVVPWILRTPAFNDPNMVMNDVLDILSKAKKDVLVLAKSNRKVDQINLVVLSRRELRLAVTSSPITLPDWFPIEPSHTVTARIEDLTWNVSVPISDEATSIGDLQRHLYEIDLALVERICFAYKESHNNVQSLWSHLYPKDRPNIATELEQFRKNLIKVANPARFRPSRQIPTAVGCIWETAGRKTPEELGRTANALLRGLHIKRRIGEYRPPLIAILNRPTNPIRDVYIWWAYCLIVSIRYSCQLVTAAAHSDEYPSFPIVMLRSTSLDVRKFLSSALQTLQLNQE